MRIGLVGLGIIGSRVAANYRKVDYEVQVWNRTPKPSESGWQDSLERLAAWADVVQLFVRDSSALLEVLPRLASAKMVINSATVAKETTLEAATALPDRFLDAPFTGSREAAAAGSLVYYVGGSPALYDAWKPCLLASAKEVIHTGDIGSATVLKIATNMVSAVSVQVLSEAMALTRAQGIPEEAFAAAMAVNASGSVLAKMKLPTMQEGNFETHFSLKNMLKDSRYALALAASTGISIPALQATTAAMEAREDAGEGELDYSVLYRQFDS
jgi:3-hydroxyisobutyrate dehydrogenase-like beta-hydroxyacid dehydrogenase